MARHRGHLRPVTGEPHDTLRSLGKGIAIPRNGVVKESVDPGHSLTQREAMASGSPQPAYMLRDGQAVFVGRCRDCRFLHENEDLFWRCGMPYVSGGIFWGDPDIIVQDPDGFGCVMWEARDDARCSSRSCSTGE